ncbi:hypothetical protein LPW11_09635 [Geomonas sp. RF6]|uniref:PEP/pyruvate-binding domain-containing protein n=1 Tax=Geomonas sp. RF6 TaxID=2897342 RepID=UPI001E3FA59C|nr:PEP/pyruvate-binding domain-containing protein [Geomonas sp. RF6]UFS72436.1 hypothetical protein LPW11_09635 [Geomonas sp. RF6]
MAALSLSTKGKTLEDLALLVRSWRALPVLRLTVAEVRNDLSAAVERIQRQMAESHLVVRSSASAEDNLATSNAGHFRSVLDVPRDDGDAIARALHAVIESYGECSESEELFVQPMLRQVSMSGVVFTADVDTLAPYYAINYDESGRTDSVTGGDTTCRSYIHFKGAPLPPEDPALRAVTLACSEIEALCGNTALDIEFAISAGELYILQVRPITRHGKDDLSALDLKDSLNKMHRKIEKLSAPHPNLLGEKTIFGVMPDWNPAEIIGLRPRQLALSLYKELVTDSVWAYQRDNYGYRNLRSHPLLVSFLGMPYIDVRVDFNSFIPKELDEQIARKLADYYLNKLDLCPELHDKVEFEIVHSCYYLNLPEKLQELESHGFNRNEIRRIEFALLDLTNGVLDASQGLYKADLAKIEELKKHHAAIHTSDLTPIEKIYWLVEYCKRYGTLPFAGVARAAFIAVQFLGSFVEAGVMTKEERGSFLASLNTVSKQLQTALCRLSAGTLTREEFFREFGHLRPGTYDILSPSYRENFDQYFSRMSESGCPHGAYSFTEEQKGQISQLLRENGIRADADGLLSFMVQAIEGREYAKLTFTRTLNDILGLIGELGTSYGVSRDDLSYLDVRTVLSLYSALDHRDLKEILLADIAVNRKLYGYTRAIKLPAVIRKASDVYGFHVEAETPNYITLGRVIAESARESEINGAEISGKVVFIRSADPGYDFLFSRKIAGLVTQFGGANSHMAIRCAELGIPAVIGAGEKNFTDWSRAGTLEIDCAGRQVRLIA